MIKVDMKYPGVGAGVYVRKAGKVLLGLRKGGHGEGEWCPPGGKLEMNEENDPSNSESWGSQLNLVLISIDDGESVNSSEYIFLAFE